MMRTIVVLAVCLSGTVCGQHATAPRFEEASVRPIDAYPSSSGIKTGRGWLTADNVTLKRCIMGAYHVGRNQIVGGPDWRTAEEE